jgi:peroxiredoxin
MTGRLILVVAFALFTSAVTRAADSPPQTLPGLKQSFRAPEFTLPGEDGKTYRLADYRGSVVIINFWATWCPPCRYEMPSLERAWRKLKDQKVVILAVNVGENADVIFEFTGQYPVSFPLPMDLDGTIIKQYPVTGLPTTYIVSPDGVATHRVVGSREWDDPKLIDALLRMRK